MLCIGIVGEIISRTSQAHPLQGAVLTPQMLFKYIPLGASFFTHGYLGKCFTRFSHPHTYWLLHLWLKGMGSTPDWDRPPVSMVFKAGKLQELWGHRGSQLVSRRKRGRHGSVWQDKGSAGSLWKVATKLWRLTQTAAGCWRSEDWTLQWGIHGAVEPAQERSQVISKHHCHGAVMSTPTGDHIMLSNGPWSYVIYSLPYWFLSLPWLTPCLIVFSYRPLGSRTFTLCPCTLELHSFPLEFYKRQQFALSLRRDFELLNIDEIGYFCFISGVL